MASLDSEIDALYQKPLDEFTSARNALAKTLSGADAARVRKLAKPTVVPWTVNQLYWRARKVYDHLRQAGERLRAAQIAALKGRSADVRHASDEQRKAIAAAVQQGTALAAEAGSHPSADELTRTLEALSLAPELPEPPGRLTRALQPAGFEALAGVPVQAVAPRPAQRHAAAPKHTGSHDGRGAAESGAPSAAARAAEARAREKAEKEAAAARHAKAARDRAEAMLDRAKAAEAQAKAAWERARDQVRAAEKELADAIKKLT